MRIRTDGDYKHRRQTIEQTAEEMGVNRTQAVLTACEHYNYDKRKKEKAIEYAAQHMGAEEVRELADLLSTMHMEVTYSFSAGVMD